MYLLYAQVASIRGEYNVHVTLTERKERDSESDEGGDEAENTTGDETEDEAGETTQDETEASDDTTQDDTMQKTVIPLALPEMVTQDPYLLV